MIFYFSATGNTRWIANTIAEAFQDQAVDLTTVNPEDYHFTEADTVGIIFPVYACVAPGLVLDFCKKLDVGNAYTYAVCNYSNYTGHAMQHFSAEAYHLHCGYGLLMPDNTSVLGWPYDNEETTLEKLRTAPQRLNEIIEKLKRREEDVFESYEGPDPEETTRTLPKLFNETIAITGPFYVEEDRCISCGICEANCPAKVIQLQDGKPVWTETHCYLCSACINHCPTEAIEYGDKSQGVYRYTYEKYSKLAAK